MKTTLKHLMTLVDDRNRWVDTDVCCYLLAVSLGLSKYDDQNVFHWFREKKEIYCTNNPIGNYLYEILDGLSKVGILEKNEDNAFRWNVLDY